MSDLNARTSVSPETPRHTDSEDNGVVSLAGLVQFSGFAVSDERLRHLTGLFRSIDVLTRLRLARRVSHSVARVLELKNIRRCLTCNALTESMDIFFTLALFAVMSIYSNFLIPRSTCQQALLTFGRVSCRSAVQLYWDLPWKVKKS